MARPRANADNLPPVEDDGDRINDGNEEVTIESAASEEARADKQSETEALNGPETGPSGTSYTGGFPKSMDESYDGKTIEVETTGDFQLYHSATKLMIPAEGSTKVPENSQFIQRNLERGKLKKV